MQLCQRGAGVFDRSRRELVPTVRAVSVDSLLYVQSSLDRLCRQKVFQQVLLLVKHCALAAAQCIVIGPVCLFLCGWVGGWVRVCVCVCVCGSVTTITRNYMHRSPPNWVCRQR